MDNVLSNCITFPVHLLDLLYMQETGNLNITGLVQLTGSFPVLLLTKKCSFHIKSYVFSKKISQRFWSGTVFLHPTKTIFRSKPFHIWTQFWEHITFMSKLHFFVSKRTGKLPVYCTRPVMYKLTVSCM